MKRSLEKMAGELRRHWKNYVGQSLLATASLYVVMRFLTIEEVVLITSIGASTFIVFAMPKSLVAQPRNLVGGHVVGFACGMLCNYIPHNASYSPGVYSVGVGLSIFVMVVTDTEHPPAAGTALYYVQNGFGWSSALPLAVATVLLALLHKLLGRRLRDLA